MNPTVAFYLRQIIRKFQEWPLTSAVNAADKCLAANKSDLLNQLYVAEKRNTAAVILHLGHITAAVHCVDKMA